MKIYKKYKTKNLIKSEKISKLIITLPSSANLREFQINKVCNELNKYFELNYGLEKTG